MDNKLQDAARMRAPVRVAAGEDRFGEHRGLGISAITFKVTPQDSSGVLILENTFHAKGGPARHLHYDQDEWFFVTEGEFVMEIGDQRFSLHPGDSVLGPQRVPHTWAYTGQGSGSGLGKMVIAFFPAGQMEAFFVETAKGNAMAPQDPEFWRRHGMELLGPPLRLE